MTRYFLQFSREERRKVEFVVMDMSSLFRSVAKSCFPHAKIIADRYPYSNGFTEGCNNKTKVLKRVCFGLRNFEHFRNRILFCSTYA